jgi:cadmium resistance protein CadD (predicted permease)
MNWLISTVIIGMSAALATTFDDNVYLTAFFGKVNHVFRSRHVVLGEFVGFTVLVIASLPGFFGGLVLPEAWIGLLGFLPIAINKDQKVAVIGVVRPFVATQVEKDYKVSCNVQPKKQLEAKYKNRPVLIAQAIYPF